MDNVARTPQQLASILKAWRTRRNLSQQDVAARVGMKQSTISTIESDATRAGIGTLYKLLSALGIELVIRERGRGSSRKEW